jgi:predicted RNA binding protein YcfA (HicA-like mRNA interferase family)
MKIPRDVSGEQLVRCLKRLGYQVVRQESSHARLTHPGPPQHHVTVPMHKTLRVGMLQAILKQVAEQRSTTLDALIEDL